MNTDYYCHNCEKSVTPIIEIRSGAQCKKCPDCKAQVAHQPPKASDSGKEPIRPAGFGQTPRSPTRATKGWG